MELDQAMLSDCSIYIPPVNICKVVKVYDGDTITIATKLFTENIYKFNVRLRGIDCPEIRSNDNSEKKAARIVQSELYKYIIHQMVKLSDVDYDKYGRLLANVSFNDTDLSTWLLSKHFAVKYDGGHKVTPDNWLEYIQ